MDTKVTGKTMYIPYSGKTVRFINQRSREWTHPYEYPPQPGGTLSTSGCGIFSACFAVEKMCGQRIDVEELADFSCREGGRGDDGTDRPALLSAMEKRGLARQYGFHYAFDDLVNDEAALWQTLTEGGCALCNLRVGHIVTLLDARVQNGVKQVLALDSHSESADARVADHVIEVMPGSEVIYPVKNAAGLITGYAQAYALYWVPLSLPKDASLLHPIQ